MENSYVITKMSDDTTVVIVTESFLNESSEADTQRVSIKNFIFSDIIFLHLFLKK